MTLEEIDNQLEQYFKQWKELNYIEEEGHTTKALQLQSLIVQLNILKELRILNLNIKSMESYG
jgi:hypothetical protein